MITESSALELRHHRGQPKHYLAGRLVEDGEIIELSLPNSSWLAGIYEWGGEESRWPTLRFTIGGPWERTVALAKQPTMTARLTPGCIMRWPLPQLR